MVIANGFITATVSEAYKEVNNRCGCTVQPIPFPTVDTMTYWLSEKGEIFGCQLMRNMCVTKPLRVERRYKRGCHMRYSIPGGKQKEAYMQNVMYSTYVAKEWLPDLMFTFKDGCQYNFLLGNIEPIKPKANQIMLDNIKTFQCDYDKHFTKVVNHIHWVYNDIPYDDLKDIASDTFFYLCGARYYRGNDNFTAIWIRMTERRCIDYYRRYLSGREDLFHEDSREEKFSVPAHRVEVADIWRHLRGEKCKRTMKLYSEGMTPTEISKEMDSTLSTVSSCITRSILHLQKIYRNDIDQAKRDRRIIESL